MIIWACEGGAYKFSEKNFKRFLIETKNGTGKQAEECGGKYLGRCYQGYPSEQDYFGIIEA